MYVKYLNKSFTSYSWACTETGFESAALPRVRQADTLRVRKMKLIGTLLAASCVALASAHGPLGKDILLNQDLNGNHCNENLCGEKLLLTE